MKRFRGYGLWVIGVYTLASLWVACYLRHLDAVAPWWALPAFITGLCASVALALWIEFSN